MGLTERYQKLTHAAKIVRSETEANLDIPGRVLVASLREAKPGTWELHQQSVLLPGIRNGYFTKLVA